MFNFRPALLLLSLVSLPAAAIAQNDFGQVTIGESATIPVTIKVTVAGNLNYEVLATLGYTDATGNQSEFNNVGGTCKPVGYSVGQTCTLNVTFTPTLPGTQYGAVYFRNDAGQIKATSYFHGTGVGPYASFNPGLVYARGFQSQSGNLQVLNPTPIAIGTKGDIYTTSSNVDGYIANGVNHDPTVDDISVGTVSGLAVDAADNLYLADVNNARVVEAHEDGTFSTFTNPFSATPNLVAVAMDANANLFILDGASSTVLEYPAGANSQTSPKFIAVTVAGKPLVTQNLAIDPAGNLYLTDSSRNAVVELTAAQVAGGGGDGTLITPTVNSVGLNKPSALAIDRVGDLVISDAGNKRIVVVAPSGGTNYAFVPSSTPPVSTPPFAGAGGIATDYENVLYITDPSNNQYFTVGRGGTPDLKFPSTAEGSTSSQTVQVFNGGNAPLAIGSVDFPTGFQQTPGVASPCSTTPTLAPGQFCNLPVQFAPPTTGKFSGYVHIYDNSNNYSQNLQKFQVNGTGIQGSLVLSATSLSFGSQNTFTTSASQQVTFTNNSAAAVTITGFQVTGAQASAFTFATNCPSTLAVGSSCTIHGHFSPTAALNYSATVSLAVKGFPSQNITVSGQGVGASQPKGAVSTSTLAYGNQKVGTSSASQSFTLQSTGGQPLSITGIKVTGTNASSFVIGYDCPASLAAGSSCSIHGHFSPTTTGGLTAAITITTNSSTAIAPVTLTGTGTP